MARPLAFASPEMVVEVEDRSKGKPMPPRSGAGGTKWASQTLAGPENRPKEDAIYEAMFHQPFGTTTFFDTRLNPHVAAPDNRDGATRVSLEGRRLTFSVNTAAWNK